MVISECKLSKSNPYAIFSISCRYNLGTSGLVTNVSVFEDPLIMDIPTLYLENSANTGTSFFCKKEAFRLFADV